MVDAGRLASLGRRAKDVVAVAAIMAMVAHNHFNVRSARDLGVDDEAWYVGGGVLVGKPGFPNGPNGLPLAELGPLHCLSYLPLSKIFPAPVDLYYAAWELRTMLLALAIYALVRRMNAPWWQALLASFVFVNCEIADVWPFPVHTAALVVLTGVLAATFARTTTARLGTVTIAFAVAGFCRPELLYAYGVALLVFVVHLVRAKERAWAWLAATIVPAILLFSIFGNPLGGTRSFFAFGQHYTLVLFRAEGRTDDPWANWLPTTEHDFPGASTIGQALRTNPVAFLRHVGRNMLFFPQRFFHVTRARLPVAAALEYLLWIVGLGVAVVQLRRIWQTRTPLQRTLAFALGCAAIPFFVSAFVVHPRDHYFVLVVVLTIALVASMPVVLPVPKMGVAAQAALVGAAYLAAVTLTATKSDKATIGEWLTNRPANTTLFGSRQPTIAALRALHLQGHVVSLEYAWGTCLYAGYECEPYMRWDKQAPFDEFVAQHNVDIVVFTDEMTHDVRFESDEQFRDFLEHPVAHGFDVQDVPGTKVHIGVRRR